MAKTGKSVSRIRRWQRFRWLDRMSGWWRARAERERRGHHAPDLWSVWAAAPLVLAAGGLTIWFLYLRVHAVAVPVEVPGGRPRVDSLDVLRTTLSVVAFVGALLAGLYAYRKQRLAEGDAARADATQFSDRYTKAADQLGSDQAAIRLAGVYAMARLADDWREQRQTCIDVLCAYLRMPYALPGEADHRPGEGQVRQTIVRVITGHLRPQAAVSWSHTDFDFTHAHLEGASFYEVTFSGTASFGGATFSDAFFGGATFSNAVTFNGATFSGTTRFGRATFSGTTWFDEATFTGPAWFDGATFSGATTFGEATFSDTTLFDLATFSGPATFDGATFSGPTTFDWATFSGATTFDGVTFSTSPGLHRVVGVERITGLLQPPSAP